MSGKKNIKQHANEAHVDDGTAKLNWLRASVLGANDGIVSVAGLIVGVAGATNDRSTILTAGVAGIVAGAISMAAGEYVSVSTQRDSEKAMLAKERKELEDDPEEELEELVSLYESKGLTRSTAEKVADELTKHDEFAAHVDVELRIDPNHLTNAWQAAGASALSFTFGAAIPLFAIAIPPESVRVQATFVAVAVALAITGSLSAWAGQSSLRKATLRVLAGGILAMTVTYYVGKLFGVIGA